MQVARKGDYITTLTGKEFYPLDTPFVWLACECGYRSERFDSEQEFEAQHLSWTTAAQATEGR